MPGVQSRKIQTNFTAGEISSRLRGRVDVEKYYNAVEKLQNMIPRPQGGAYRRPGTHFVAEVKDSSDECICIPFSFSTVQNYVLELGDQYLRVYRARGQVVETPVVITAITQASPAAVTTSGAHGYSTGDQVYLDDIGGMTELEGRRFTITVTGGTTFTLDGEDSTSYTAYTSGGTATEIYEVATPWLVADIDKLQVTQSADVLYVVHPDYQPRKISRTADNSWTVSLYDFVDGPYLNTNTTSTTVQASATTGSVTLTASSGIFASTDVGRLVRTRVAGAWGYAKITAYSSTTQVTADVKETLGGTGAVTDWRFGAWSDTTGWPSAVGFFQDRLFFGNTDDNPNTLWGSKTGDYENHEPTDASGTVSDDNGVNFTIADNQVNAIRWLSPEETELFIGTSDAIHSLYGGTSSGAVVPVTPTNVGIRRVAAHGSGEDVQPMRIGENIYFVTRSKRRVRRVEFVTNRGFIARDMTLFAEHILGGDIKDTSAAEEIDPIGWYVRDSGKLLGNSVEKEEDVNAWHTHVIGGSFGSSDAVVESVAVIPNPTLKKGDDVWLIVKRTIGGTTKRYIEYMGDPFDPDEEGQSSGFFVDSGLTYDGFVAGTLTPAATSGDGVTFTASDSVFDSSMVGDKLFEVNSSGVKTGSATITTFNSATSVDADITKSFSGTSAIATGSWCIARDGFSGMDHLNGESVQVAGDGAALPNVTISNGSFTLDRHYCKIHAGLGYKSIVKGLPYEDERLGTTQGLRQKIETIFVSLFRSLGLKFGVEGGTLEELPARSGTDIMDMPPPLFTGLKKLEWPDGIEDEPVMYLEQEKPLPMEILFAVAEVRFYG